jgi:hypothetical protein
MYRALHCWGTREIGTVVMMLATVGTVFWTWNSMWPATSSSSLSRWPPP